MYQMNGSSHCFFFLKNKTFKLRVKYVWTLDAGTSFRFSLKQSLSLTSFYQFVKVFFKGVESRTGALNLCMICLQTLSTKIVSTKFCT
ncbi:hypothetical protein Bca4012_006296 [Brassica carinata]|uniref:BnaCnng50700D protein n=3 Tax=Brassica TaxID=3705 RepID=A0A078JKR9_BRANA|nr:BnaCnng50700D [Brassica napus]VDC96736.1 unnamed protein product [Brassica oleracea]